jgi:hypothetical protein
VAPPSVSQAARRGTERSGCGSLVLTGPLNSTSRQRTRRRRLLEPVDITGTSGRGECAARRATRARSIFARLRRPRTGSCVRITKERRSLVRRQRADQLRTAHQAALSGGRPSVDEWAFDLWSHDEVAPNSDAIMGRLRHTGLKLFRHGQAAGSRQLTPKPGPTLLEREGRGRDSSRDHQDASTADQP